MTHNPHDKLFRAIFSEPDNAALYLQDRLPAALVARLDLSRTERIPGTWVDEAMRDHQSDLLFAIPLSPGSQDAAPGASAGPGAAESGASAEQGRASDAKSGGEAAGEPGGEAAGEPGGEVAGEPDGEVAGEPGGEVAGEPGGAALVLLYVLLEHQSTVSRQMAFRLLRYLVRALGASLRIASRGLIAPGTPSPRGLNRPVAPLRASFGHADLSPLARDPWRTQFVGKLLDQWSRDHPGRPLPPIMPLVLYHGEADWTAPLVLEDLFDLEALGEPARAAVTPYLPALRYVVECLPEDPRAIKAPPGIVRLTLRVLKVGRRREVRSLLLQWFEDFVVEGHKGQRGLHHIGLVVQYLLIVNEAVTPENLVEALKPMGTEAQEIPKTYGLRLIQKGREEGLEQGLEQGREALRQVARKLIAVGWPLSEVAEATGLSMDELRKLAH